MDTFAHSAPDRQPRVRAQAAFTLVEVTLAVGIVAFAFLAVFGMIPTGLTIFRQTMDTSVGSQIAQQVINEAKQADFDNLTQTTSPGSPNTVTFTKGVRYFDDQGNELSLPAGGVSPPAGSVLSPPAHTLYLVNTRVEPNTTIPTTTDTLLANNVYLATVTVQVANNPANIFLSVGTDSTKPTYDLWTSAYQGGTTTPGKVAVATWFTMVARNK